MPTFISSATDSGRVPRISDGEVEPLKRYDAHGTWRTITAYVSISEYTDGTPCIGADGTNLCERWQDGETLCAANFVPMGSVLILDNQEKADGVDAIVCTVVDRMASRYSNRVDLYMGYDLHGARQFGKKTMYVRQYDL